MCCCFCACAVFIRAGHFVLVFTVRDANGQFKFDKVAVWVHPTLEQFVPIAVMPLQPHKIIVYPRELRSNRLTRHVRGVYTCLVPTNTTIQLLFAKGTYLLQVSCYPAHSMLPATKVLYRLAKVVA